MDIKTPTRGLAYIVLAGALLLAAIALNDRQYRTTEVPELSPTPRALDGELARCNAIGAEEANDAVCKAVWEANRKRFFESRKSSSPADVSKTSPQSPATPRAGPSPSFGDGRGARDQ
jgi:conjugative transfer region protein TrbK